MAKNSGKSVAELDKILVSDRLYNRQEVALLIGTGWANVLEASRGESPALKGTLTTKGKVSTWLFTGEAILAWRTGVENRTNKIPHISIPLLVDTDIFELKKLLKGSKFEKYAV
jgi:hypothetical protein